MLIHHFFTPELSINSYLVYDEIAKVGALIDPARNISDYLKFARLKQIIITDILETHVHADFISGAYELKQALGNKPNIHCSGMGGKEWIPAYADKVVKDGGGVILGVVCLKALHTPGHTFEHIIWLGFDENYSSTIPKAAFTGDLLFLGSVGRPDLLGEEARKKLSKKLYNSLKMVSELPNSVEVYPSHGAGSLCGKKISQGVFSTIGHEKSMNPGLALQDFDKWKSSLFEEMSQAPQYFFELKRKNLKVNPEKKEPCRINKDFIDQALASCIAVDVREPKTYSTGSFKGAINIPLGPSITLWTGSVLGLDRPLFLIGDNEKEIEKACHALRLIGLDNILYCAVLGEWNEADKSNFFHKSPMIDASSLFKDQGSYYILDVRTKKEWDAAHIEGAHLMTLTDVPREVYNIPQDKAIAVICHSGNRASVAASFISKELNVQAINVLGGMQAWTQQNLPTTSSDLKGL